MKRVLEAEQNLRWFGPWLLGFVLSLLVSAPLTQAQDNEKTLSPKEARQRIDTIVEDTRELKGRPPQELLGYVREGLRLAQQHDFAALKIQLFCNGSRIVEAAGDIKLAEKFLDMALSNAQELSETSQQIEILKKHGELLARSFDYESAMRYLVAAQKLCESEGDSDASIRLTNQLAIYCATIGDGNRAESYVQAGIAANTDKKESIIAQSHRTMAVVQLILSDSYKSELPEYIQLVVQDLQRNEAQAALNSVVPTTVHDAIGKAMAYYEHTNNRPGRALCYQLKGDIARVAKDLPLAREFYQKALNLCSGPETDTTRVSVTVALSVIDALQQQFKGAYSRVDRVIEQIEGSMDTPWLYLLKAEIATHDYDDAQAEAFLQKGLAIAHSQNNLFQLAALYQLQSRLQINLGEFNDGIESLNLAHTYALKTTEDTANRKIVQHYSEAQNKEHSYRNRSNNDQQQIKRELDSYRFYFKISWMLGMALLLLSIAMLFIRAGTQKRAEKGLRQAEQEINSLKFSLNKAINEQNTIFKNLAQEMRTPLSGIVGSIPLLHDTTMTPLQENCINIIDVSSRSITTLINDISDLSKLDSGEFKLARDTVDLVQITESVAQLFVSDSEQTHVELICDLPSDPIPFVKGDANRIQQILLTLVGRSFQTTFQGHVMVKLESLIAESDREFDVRLTIEDSGTGIEGQAVEKVFEISPTLTNINSLRRPASMLGMAICKKLVEAMRGTIEIRAQRKGGLKVVVVLPFTLDSGEAGWALRDPYERFPKKRALLIDPKQSSAKLLARHLHAWGLTVESVEKIDQADSVLNKQEVFDSILLDVDAAASEAAILKDIQTIRKSEKAAETPIILLIPHTDFHVGPDLKRQKYIHLLAKPVQVAELHSRVRQAIVYKSPLTQSYATLTPETKPVEEQALTPQTDPNTGFRFIPYILPFRTNTQLNENLSILLVEDNAVNQKVTSLMLKKIGFDIDVVGNGKDAIQAVKKGKYDVVLMDKVMPHMDGLETTLNIRKLTEIEQPIIIALTASASMEDEIACRKATMDNFLAKPVQFEKMKAALAFASGVLDQRRLIQPESF